MAAPTESARPAGGSSESTMTVASALRLARGCQRFVPSRSRMASARLPSVADSAPDQQAPDANARNRASASSDLHAALVAEQLVPFVDDDHAELAEQVLRVGAGQHERQAFGRRDQHGWQSPGLGAALGGVGVAAACTGAPGGRQIFEWLLQGAQGVRCQGAHGGEPEDGESRSRGRRVAGRRAAAAGDVGECQQRAKPHGVGLAGAGGGVKQTRAAVGNGLPHLALELEGLPAAIRKPLDQRRLFHALAPSPVGGRSGPGHSSLEAPVPPSLPFPGGGRSKAARVSSVSASSTGLSSRHRSMRGKRTAMPDLCRVTRGCPRSRARTPASA